MHRQLNPTLFLSKVVQKERPLGAVRGRPFLPFLARSTRPSLWASCRREPPWDEIWMRTFASGRSNDVSPTYRNEAAMCLGRFLYIRQKGGRGNLLVSNLNKLCRWFRKTITTTPFSLYQGLLDAGRPLGSSGNSESCPKEAIRTHSYPSVLATVPVPAAKGPKTRGPYQERFCEWFLFFCYRNRSAQNHPHS